jgi:hypothetical protein
MPEETRLLPETPAMPIAGKKQVNSYSASSVSPRTSSPTLGEQ